jgi:streptogramin lyase
MWLRGLRGSKRSNRRLNFRPRVEALENRLVPSVTINEFAIPTQNSNPGGIAGGPDGNIWFTEQTGNNIGHISPTGHFSEVVLPNDASTPFGIVSGPDGAMWFTEQTGNRIGRIALDGTIKEFTNGLTANSGPTGITLGPDGNLWFTEQSVGQIGQITPAGVITEFRLPRATSSPQSITVGPDGRLWFTESGTNQIGRITTNGSLTEFALPSDAFSPAPVGIAAGPDGNLWVTLSGTNKIASVTTAGMVNEFTIPTAASGPRGITVAPDGNLWFTETNTSQIGRVTVAGSFTETATPTSSSFPAFITNGPDGNLWFTESNSNNIAKLILPHFVVAGPDAGGGPDVRVIDPTTGAIIKEILAYDPRFLGGVRVAVGDVNHDGIPDIVTAPGKGGGPDIRVFDGVTGQLIRDFMAYDPRFTGGVFVAVGDLNQDGYADIITGADSGGGPEVKVFSGKDNSVLADFMAYDFRFSGGVRVASADVNGDGRADIITGAGPGGGPHVKVISGVNGALLQSYYAFAPTFSGGVYVAAGDLDGDGKADVVVGAGKGGNPEVKVFSGANTGVLRDFLAYGANVIAGVRVAAFDLNGDGHTEIITVTGPDTQPQVKVFDGATNALIDNFFAYSALFLGGVYIGAH